MKDFFKLMNYNVYGKTMNNLRNRVKVKWINNAKDYIKYGNQSTYFSQKIFSKRFVSIREIKPVLTLDKPDHLEFKPEFSILNLSKLFILNFIAIT